MWCLKQCIYAQWCSAIQYLLLRNWNLRSLARECFLFVQTSVFIEFTKMWIIHTNLLMQFCHWQPSFKHFFPPKIKTSQVSIFILMNSPLYNGSFLKRFTMPKGTSHLSSTIFCISLAVQFYPFINILRTLTLEICWKSNHTTKILYWTMVPLCYFCDRSISDTNTVSQIQLSQLSSWRTLYKCPYTSITDSKRET